MKARISLAAVAGWSFGLIVLSIGVLNLVLIHWVPGTVFSLLSLLYFPPVDRFFQRQFGRSVPLGIKIFLGFVILWFTLGVSDLGDLID